MNIKQLASTSALFLTLGLQLAPLQASQPVNVLSQICDTASAELLQLGEEYYHLRPEPAPMTEQASEALTNLYRGLTGIWQGTVTFKVCAGSTTNAAPRSETRELKRVQVSISSPGQLILRSDGVSFGLPSANEITSLHALGKESLRLSQRFQRGTVNRTTQSRVAALRERQDALSVGNQGKLLRLETNWYSNGYYTGSEITELRKLR